MNSHIEIRNLLSDFVDGALPRRERGEVAAHLAGCDECRLDAEAYTALIVGARALPREIAPGRDLWPGIAARIGAAGAAPRDGVEEVDVRPLARYAWRSAALAVAAAIALVVLSSAVTALLVRPAPAPLVSLAAERAAPRVRESTALAAYRPAEAQFQATARDLAAELEARRLLLAPETVAVIEANLRIIDAAIREAHAALEADPSSAVLPGHLSDVYRQKVDLLTTAVELPART